MPGNCVHFCCAKGPSSGPLVNIPQATKRIKYKDTEGVKLTLQEVMRWRRLFLKSAGFSGEDLQAAMLKKDMRVCVAHLPEKMLHRGPLRHGFSKVFLSYNRAHPEEHVCKPRHYMSPIKSITPQQRQETGVLEQMSAAAQSGEVGFSPEDVRQVKRKLTQFTADSEAQVEVGAAWAQDRLRVKELQKEIVALEESKRMLLEESPWLRWRKLRAAGTTDKRVYVLTGFASLSAVEAYFGLIEAYCIATGTSVHTLDMYHGQKNYERKGDSGRGGGRPCELDAMDQLFFELFVLRTGQHLDVAAALFGISTTTATSYFVTWLDLLARVMMHEMPFPDQATTRATMPPEWKGAFGNDRIRIVLDCTNINLETHSDPDVQCVTYSKYYAGNVAKILVGTSASGAITFCSLGYPGKISDNTITEESILKLGLLDAGDDVMADKGFTIHHLLYERLMGLHMPPKKKGGLMSAANCYTTSKIANKRIHVERAMKRIKAFSYLKRTIPIVQFDIVSHLVSSNYVRSVLQSYRTIILVLGVRGGHDLKLPTTTERF